MKSFRLLFVFILFAVLSVGKSFAQTTRLSTEIDSVEVGDVFSLNVKIQLNTPVDRLLTPDSTSLPPSLEWMGIQQYKITDFSDSLRISVQFFGSSDLFVPGLPIRFITDGDTTTSYTNNLVIPFRSVLPSDDAELKALKPIFDFKSFPWAWVIIIAALIAAAIWGYFTFLKKKEEPTVVKVVQNQPFVSPLTQLEQTLNTLKNEYNLAQTQDFKYFYSTVSDSIRAYFEELYDIPALESTTRELLRYLDAFGVDMEMIKQTRAILNKSDMVKFAKFTPTIEGAWACHSDAVTFLERAKLIDAGRITRKKMEFESKWEMTEPELDEESNPEKEEA